MTSLFIPAVSIPILALAGACQPVGTGGEAAGPAGNEEMAGVYAGIGPEELLRFTGTEPFWGGDVSGGELTYTTPENPDGTIIRVERFAGNNGLGYSGDLAGREFDMAVTPGECSDAMSDRTYPFVVTLRIGGEVRNGCGWTDAMPFTGPEAP